MHVEKWWIIQNYYMLKTDYIFKTNLPKSSLFKSILPTSEISFKNQVDSMATMEYNPDYCSNDFECSDNEELFEED